MTHKFDTNSKSKLDNSRRREILPPNQILTEIGLKAGDKFADIGAGIGYFSIPAAYVVGDSGKVFALDISLEMLEDVEKKAEENSLKNIRTIVTQKYDLKLEDDSADIAFICTVLHEIEDIKRFVNETRRILKVGGRISIIEWKKQEADMGPPIYHRLDEDTIKRTLTESGFTNIDKIDIGKYFYCITAGK